MLKMWTKASLQCYSQFSVEFFLFKKSEKYRNKSNEQVWKQILCLFSRGTEAAQFSSIKDIQSDLEYHFRGFFLFFCSILVWWGLDCYHSAGLGHGIRLIMMFILKVLLISWTPCYLLQLGLHLLPVENPFFSEKNRFDVLTAACVSELCCVPAGISKVLDALCWSTWQLYTNQKRAKEDINVDEVLFCQNILVLLIQAVNSQNLTHPH